MLRAGNNNSNQARKPNPNTLLRATNRGRRITSNNTTLHQANNKAAHTTDSTRASSTTLRNNKKVRLMGKATTTETLSIKLIPIEADALNQICLLTLSRSPSRVASVSFNSKLQIKGLTYNLSKL
jgi:hypothetical protein